MAIVTIKFNTETLEISHTIEEDKQVKLQEDEQVSETSIPAAAAEPNPATEQPTA